MGLFTSKSKVKDMTPLEVSGSRKYLYNLLQQYAPGQSPKFPVMQVPGMTDTEKTLQGRISTLASGDTEGYRLAMDYAKDQLAGYENPANNPYYQGIKAESLALDAQNNANVRRQAQLAGQGRSTASGAVQGQNTTATNRYLTTILGQLAEQDKDRRANAANLAGSLGNQEVQNMGQLSALAAIPRNIETVQNQAIYEALMREMLFPYQEQLAVTSAINGLQPTYVQTGGGMTDLGFLLNAGATIAAGAAGAG